MNEQHYQNVFESLGRILVEEDTVSASDIRAAEQRLGTRIPEAVHAFYRIAGNATDFTAFYDRFIPPGEWTLHHGKLVFVEENQVVVYYGVAVGSAVPADPPVYMAASEGTQDWFEVCSRCSSFITAMLHWEAAFGGVLPFRGSALASSSTRQTLDSGWSFAGEVNGMRAYSRPGRAVCYVNWSDGWRVFAGATSDVDLLSAESELGLTWVA